MAIVMEEDISAVLERKIIVAMIISKKFLKSMELIFNEKELRFSTKHTQAIAEWCWEYYLKYKKPISKEIYSVFKVKKLEEEDRKLIERFLNEISDEYVEGRKLNIDYIIDIAENYFKKVSVKNLKNKIQKCLASDNIEEAEKLIGKFTTKIALKKVDWVNPFSKAEITETFQDEEGEEILHLPGHLGKMIGSLCREYLVAYLAKSGTGKTWCLSELALLGMLQGCNVLYINLEMSKKQMKKRFYQMITNRPSFKDERILIPVFDCQLNQENSCTKPERTCNEGIIRGRTKEISFNETSKSYIPCQECKTYKEKTDYQMETWLISLKKKIIDAGKVSKTVQSLSDFNHFNGGKLRLATYSAGSLTLKSLESEIDKSVCFEGFFPDIIITDYADKFVSDKSLEQYRHHLMQIWLQHKAMGQKYHALVATGSQSSAMRGDADTKYFDWAEGICKINEIDVGIILNQSMEEKRNGVIRYCIGKHRHRAFNPLNEVTVLYNYNIGKPYLDSHYEQR